MIPSLLQIPSAVSDSKLHSVLPNNGKGDFQFERSTGATRINRDGLIEEVGYFSSELVQNGDFSELGSELITNGDFATDINWDKLNATINNGKATVNVVDGAFSFVNQDKSLTSGKTFKLTAEVKGLSSSLGKQIKFQDKSNNTGGLTSANGTITLNESLQNIEIYWVANSNSAQIIVSRVSSGTYSFEIDNVSVKQVDPNDRWNLDTDWSYGNNKVTFDYISSTRKIYQDNLSLDSSKNYKLKFTIQDIISGTPNIWIGNSGGTQQMVNYTDYPAGSYSLIVSPPSDSTTLAFWCRYADFSITNISLVEVQGDRPRLSYDITNGAVEDQPHLLLEPSSTNLLTFSEDFNNGWAVNQTTRVANAGVCPDGTNNAFNLIANAASGVHLLSFSGTGTNQRTMSIFAKKNGYTRFRFNTGSSGLGFASFNLANGTVAATGGTFFNNAKIESLPNDWYRCSMTMDSGGSTTVTIAMEDDAGNVTFTGDGTNGILLWGGMLEEQSYATSYIPTAGTTITRAAETCNNSKPSVNSTEGVLYAEIANIANDLTNKKISISDGTTSNSVLIFYTNVNNAIQCKVTVGGSASMNHYFSISDVTSFSKLALKWKANDFAIWLDGSEVHTDTSGGSFSAGTLTTVNFDRGDGGEDFYGKVKGLAVYNEALSESQLMQLTGVTASSIYSNFVTRTASFTVEALNEVKKVIDNL
jgi:hypothetical protein